MTTNNHTEQPNMFTFSPASTFASGSDLSHKFPGAEISIARFVESLGVLSFFLTCQSQTTDGTYPRLQLVIPPENDPHHASEKGSQAGPKSRGSGQPRPRGSGTGSVTGCHLGRLVQQAI